MVALVYHSKKHVDFKTSKTTTTHTTPGKLDRPTPTLCWRKMTRKSRERWSPAATRDFYSSRTDTMRYDGSPTCRFGGWRVCYEFDQCRGWLCFFSFKQVACAILVPNGSQYQPLWVRYYLVLQLTNCIYHYLLALTLIN